MARPSPICSAPRRAACVPAAGFTYVGLLVLIAIIGIATAYTAQVNALVQQRANEEELLFVGRQFAAAFRSYYEATPAGQRPYPAKLEDLLKDPRYPGIRRHLRKIFVDPVTGKAEWGIVWLNKGSGIDGKGSGVVAVYKIGRAHV